MIQRITLSTDSHANNKSSRPDGFCKKGVLKNFGKLKKRLQHRYFPANFEKTLKATPRFWPCYTGIAL